MGTPLHLLIVEDSAAAAVSLARELRRGGYGPICRRVETAEAMKAGARRDARRSQEAL